LQHRAHHRHGEIALEIAVAVPVENGDDVAGPYAEFCEPAREPPDALAEDPVAVPRQVPVDDLLIGRVHHRVVQQMLDEKGILIGRRTDVDEFAWHGANASLVIEKLRDNTVVPHQCVDLDQVYSVIVPGRSDDWSFFILKCRPSGDLTEMRIPTDVALRLDRRSSLRWTNCSRRGEGAAEPSRLPGVTLEGAQC